VTTIKQAEQNTPAQEKTLDELLSALKSIDAKRGKKNKPRPIITRYALKNEKNEVRRRIMEISKMIVSIFYDTFP